jgi:hypothetical protein
MQSRSEVPHSFPGRSQQNSPSHSCSELAPSPPPPLLVGIDKTFFRLHAAYQVSTTTTPNSTPNNRIAVDEQQQKQQQTKCPTTTLASLPRLPSAPPPLLRLHAKSSSPEVSQRILWVRFRPGFRRWEESLCLSVFSPIPIPLRRCMQTGLERHVLRSRLFPKALRQPALTPPLPAVSSSSSAQSTKKTSKTQSSMPTPTIPLTE